MLRIQVELPTTMRSLVVLAAVLRLSDAATVQCTINGQVPSLGNVSVSSIKEVAFSNPTVTFTFGPASSTLLLTSAVVTGVEIGQNLTGESFYIDAAGNNAMQVDTVEVKRVGSDLCEFIFHDTHGKPLQHSHHLIMSAGTDGLYAYDVMRAVENTGISEVRMNVRWDRCILDNAYNWERGHDSQQPTYAYLYTQYKVQDETWRVDGKNNASLACPDSNEGGLPAGTVYTKYQWSLYHAENPMWGHYGVGQTTDGTNVGIGAWFTPLGGISGHTSAANYGVGPNHQDLALHQDTIVLNYMGVNHYGEPSYSLKAGYQRVYGPWLTYVTTGQPTSPTWPDDMIADATTIAWTNINASIPALPVVDDPEHYAPAASRSTVTGTIAVTDGRAGAPLFVLLSTEAVQGVVDSVHEAAYWVVSSSNGSFSIPGVPPGVYNLYTWGNAGSITDQLRVDNINVQGPVTNVGSIPWTPVGSNRTLLWQIGQADRFGTEFNLGTHVRGWDLPGLIPGDLTFTVGSSHEPTDWYYAQTQGGTWTVNFDLPQGGYSGTAYITVSASMTQGNSPTVAVNGKNNAVTGSTPQGNDSTLSRQTVRSGYPRLSVLTFDASLLVKGTNTITFSRPAAQGSSNTGMGWDTVLLEVDQQSSDALAKLLVQDLKVSPTPGRPGSYHVTGSVANTGSGHAYDVRLAGVELVPTTRQGLGCDAVSIVGPSRDAIVPHVTRVDGIEGRDPARHPVPLASWLAPGQAMPFELDIEAPYLQQTSATKAMSSVPVVLEVLATAGGGRTQTRAKADVTAGGASVTGAQLLAITRDGDATARCVEVVKHHYLASATREPAA